MWVLHRCVYNKARLLAGAIVIAYIAISFLDSLFLRAATTSDSENSPECVIPAYDEIKTDIVAGQLVYNYNSKETTDDESLLSEFRRSVTEIINTHPDTSGKKRYYPIFSVFFHVHQEAFQQMAAAVICPQPISNKNEYCRNRTYFFFLHKNPKEISAIILNDIIKTVPIIRECRHPGQ